MAYSKPTSDSILWFSRLAIVQVVIGFLFVLNVVNFSIPYTADIRPFFLLMAVYYWAVFRPSLIPPAFAFVWGFLLDLLSGLPVVGLNAIILLIIQWVVRDQRVYLMGQPFPMLWAGFAVTAGVYALLLWGAVALFTLQWPAYMPTLISALLTITLFPIIGLLLVLTHRLLPQESSRGLR